MDNRANYQVDIGGNVFIAIQNMFAEFTKIVQVVEKVDESVQNSTRQITEHVDKSANAFGGLQKQIERISLTSIIEQVKQLAEGVANLTGPGIGFEQSMADLSSITGIAGDELRDLGKVARQTGKESGLGAQQAANAFALLASQIQVDKIGMEGLKALQQNTITLSHAAGMSMNDAATALAGTINQFGLQATEANRVINILAAGSKYGAAEIVDLSQSFKVVGAAANAAGLTVEDTAGAIEVLSKNNLKGAEAGTALRNIMLKMQTVLGVDFRKNSFSDALDALKPRLTDAAYRGHLLPQRQGLFQILSCHNTMKIVTLGEIMLRLSTPGNTRFVQSDSFDVVYGGGEANVAVSCANYGHEAYFVSKLPKHEIGQSAVNALRKYGVRTDFIARGGDRVGIYYLETGASMRPSKVIYDRAHSSIAEADPQDFDFDAIMEGADWFHWSGITPAISDKAAELTRLACEAARRHGVTVSVDLNFRKKLWTKEKAQSIMKPLMQYVDVCIGNEEDAELCLGFKPDADVEGGETNAEGYKGIFRQMAATFGFKYVISTLRESFSATHNGWKAMIYNGEEFYESKRYDIDPIIDRVGGGDSFSGGVIHGLLTKPTQGEALEFAVAASALKHTINGDFNLVSAEEVESLAGGNASGRVQR